MQRWPKWLGAALAGLALALAVPAAACWAPEAPVSALAARWAPVPSQFIPIDGMQLHLRDEGPREDPMPVVLLHGTSASLHTWEGWVAGLRGQHRVITFDLPAFGLTGPAPDGDYRIEAYVRHVIAVLDYLGIQHCVLGGNSLGGAIAWSTALAYPKRIDRLILVDAAGYAVKPDSVPLGFRLARMPLLGRLISHFLPRSLIASSLRNVYGHPERITPALVDRYYAMTTRAGNRQALLLRVQGAASGPPAGRIRELTLPTLIVWGGQDRLIPPAAGRRFAADIAGSQWVEFADLGHVPHEEDPARTLAPVLAFLADAGADAGSNPGSNPGAARGSSLQ